MDVLGAMGLRSSQARGGLGTRVRILMNPKTDTQKALLELEPALRKTRVRELRGPVAPKKSS